MSKKLVNSTLIVPADDIFPENVRAFSTTRVGGVSMAPYGAGQSGGGFNLGDHVGDDPAAVLHNRQLLSRYLPSDIAFLSQIHGIEVVDAYQANYSKQVADGCFTNRVGSVCAILTADCLPVLFSDLNGTVVAAAHAGWRGLASGILEVTVKKMRESGAKDILAWMGPAIGPAKFEVGHEVVGAFSHFGAPEDFFLNQGAGKYLADIYSLARRSLVDAGVTAVAGGEHCTVTESQKFYSYRRDGITGRMASVIWMV